nr:response regulator [Geothrix sp. SG198]
MTTFQTVLIGRQCRERPGRLPFPGASVKILVVDDSPTMRRIIIGNLSRLGHTDVVEGENGRSGLEQLDRGGVDLIITDWDMPEMDGIAFARAVRSRGATMPILMVTTHAATQDIVQALEAGVSTYVVKPFTQESLREKIDSLLG